MNSLKKLQNLWEQLLSSIVRNSEQVENLIQFRETKDISNERLNQLRISFNQFDEYRTGRLNANQFKSCLLSFGYNFIENNEQTFGSDFQRIMNISDPNNTGFVTFVSFLDFVVKENSYKDYLEDIIQSFRILSSNKV